jgi:hypothetical protein
LHGIVEGVGTALERSGRVLNPLDHVETLTYLINKYPVSNSCATIKEGRTRGGRIRWQWPKEFLAINEHFMSYGVRAPPSERDTN